MTDAQTPRTETLGARDLIWLAGACCLLFAVLAPTLPWLEFASGGENLLVATALESERSGKWLQPTLNAEPRIAKPPLPMWVAGASIRSQTARDLSHSDLAVRARARRELAWQARWPFLLGACLLAAAAFELGRVLTERRTVAWIAFAVCATNLMVLRAARAATTDIALALFVALALVGFAHAIFRGRWISGSLGAGVAMGLGMMSKGPVVFLQSALPVAVFLGWRAWGRHRRGDAATPGAPRRAGVAIVLCTLAALSVGLPWYVAVLLDHPEAWSRWRVEILREGATGLKPGHWYNYLSFIPLMTPWIVFFLLGFGITVLAAVRAGVRKELSGPVLAVLCVIVPIVVMSFFRDRKERYLLPMATAGSVVAAVGLAHVRTDPRKTRRDDAVETVHWALISGLVVGLPVAGGLLLKTVDGQPWFTLGQWLSGAAVGIILAAAAILATGRRRLPMAWATAALMLYAQTWFLWGYRNTREGRSEMKPMADLIWSRYPQARVITSGEKRLAPLDLAIYLNREVVWTADPASVAADERPVVLVIRQDEDDPAPPVPPTGWEAIGKFARDDSWWHAFVRPPKSL
ncbi:MAG: phospholipid carrier-dependent glycosyltransferase [Phycisphaerae bacterium]|nr:phospholipid carrier-dependent glycosyltransferase [Phycisphaerae bacterium]MDW8263091.1 phospholipid carrier-dependent glycosyltransferase [Phycisphaerales bacterium]